MSEVYDLIEALAATTKRTEKEALLEATKGTDLEEVIKAVFAATYDNSINYWVREFPQPESYDNSITLLDGLELIEKLANRTYTGNEAIKSLTYWSSKLSKENAIVLDRIIKRDLRCGATSSTANKIWPGLIKEHPYMRCSSFNEKNLKNIKFPAFSQTKADGLYMDIIVKDGKVTYKTRSGQTLLLNFDKNDNYLATIADDFVLMGEGLISDGNGGYLSRKEGNGILNSDDIDLTRVVFKVWDYVPYEEWKAGKGKTTYKDRFYTLEAVLKDAPEAFSIVDTKIVNSVDEVVAHFKEEVEKGEEGTVLKDFRGLWADGTSKYQVKVKIEFVCELTVVGFKEGKGKHAGRLGALMFESAEGLVEVSVGGGYKDPERVKLWAERDSLPGRIAAIKSNDLIQNKNTPDKWSLFLPRIVEFRVDKTEADTFERIKEQRDAFVDTLQAIGK